MNNMNRGIKNAGIALAGIGLFGCIIYPMGYIPSSMSFLQNQSAGFVWGVFLGLVALGGVLFYFGWKGEKAKEENKTDQ